MLVDNSQDEKDGESLKNEVELAEVENIATEGLRGEKVVEDDTSLAEDDQDNESEYQSFIDSFRFERGLKLLLEIPKETIKYVYNDKLDKHIQLPSLISFKDLCIEAYGEDNIVEKRVFENKKMWDSIIKEKSENGKIENVDYDNEDNERTYEDITSFLDTMKLNNKKNPASVNENVLRKRVHEMSTRLSKQGLLCDPSEYYFNPMTMTGGNGVNKSREDYYDVFDDFIDDSEMVDDLGLSLDDLYNRNDNYMNGDSLGSSSVQTSELIYADYTDPNAFYCDNDPQRDLVDFYYDSNSSVSSELEDGDRASNDLLEEDSKKSISIRELLNNQVLKLLTQLKTDCWVYYSPKNSSLGKDSSFNNNVNNTQQTPVMDLNSAELPSFSQETIDLSTPVVKEPSLNAKYLFPQRTPKVVSYWFKSLNEKLKQISEAYTKCKSYYTNYGNVRVDRNSFGSEIKDSIDILTSSIEKDPILCKIPSLFSTIYNNYSDVAPFDSKLIQTIWQALNTTVPVCNKKKQLNLSQGDPSSLAIVNLLTKYDNFRIKWVRLILNHNQEVLYQLDLNAYESIINYPGVKSKSPEYVKLILNSISQYNSQVNLNSNVSSKERDDFVREKETVLDSGTNAPEASQEVFTVVSDTQQLDSTLTSADFKFDNYGPQNGEEIGGTSQKSDISNVQTDLIVNLHQKDEDSMTQIKLKSVCRSSEFTLQSMKAVDCDLVFDYGISLLEYIHGVNRLRLVYKDILSSNIMTKTVQKEQDSLPINGTRGLEQMIKDYLLKRFSNVSFEGRKLKDIPHRYFLNQIKLLQLKYNYKSLTSITNRKLKAGTDPKTQTCDSAARKRKRKNFKAETESSISSNKQDKDNCMKYDNLEVGETGKDQ